MTEQSKPAPVSQAAHDHVIRAAERYEKLLEKEKDMGSTEALERDIKAAYQTLAPLFLSF